MVVACISWEVTYHVVWEVCSKSTAMQSATHEPSAEDTEEAAAEALLQEAHTKLESRAPEAEHHVTEPEHRVAEVEAGPSGGELLLEAQVEALRTQWCYRRCLNRQLTKLLSHRCSELMHNLHL